jgi:hypothetical protein
MVTAQIAVAPHALIPRRHSSEGWNPVRSFMRSIYTQYFKTIFATDLRR